jgi:lactam utilization protein B
MDAGTSGAEYLADLDGAMNRFAGRAYGRDGHLVDEAELDEALDVGVRVLDRLRREHTWLSTKLRAIASTLVRLKVRLKPDTTGGVS